MRINLVRFHGDVGGGGGGSAELCVVFLTRSDVIVLTGSDVVGGLAGGGGACVGGGQSGFSDLVLPLVEQDVSSVGHDLILSGVRHLAVVKVIPLTVVLVPRVAGVMAVSESSVVIGHSDEVVAARRLPIGLTLPQEAAGEVQLSQGEVHDAV